MAVGLNLAAARSEAYRAAGRIGRQLRQRSAEALEVDAPPEPGGVPVRLDGVEQGLRAAGPDLAAAPVGTELLELRRSEMPRLRCLVAEIASVHRMQVIVGV